MRAENLLHYRILSMTYFLLDGLEGLVVILVSERQNGSNDWVDDGNLGAVELHDVSQHLDYGIDLHGSIFAGLQGFTLLDEDVRYF